ncbi:MAG: diaminopimelate epimerase [Gammaproteobacteria bacterium]|nr:diaminopimelate epimerase [Gammaproteobacteria bacterium]
MTLAFTKMHGLGNDFVLIDALARPVKLTGARIRFIADRKQGVGCDQLLLIEPARTSDVDFRYRIFNADGGEVEQCGNGARCVARYLHERGLIAHADARLETAGGIIAVRVEQTGLVTVNMGRPHLAPRDIPFIADSQATSYSIEVAGEEIELSAVSMGNPHAVLLVDDVSAAPVGTLGAKLESHPRFPKRVNVGFMQVIDRRCVRLRVYERGVGETLACGSSACAAVVAGRLRGLLDERVTVGLAGGELMISWPDTHAPVHMTGPATKAFEGSIDHDQGARIEACGRDVVRARDRAIPS